MKGNQIHRQKDEKGINRASETQTMTDKGREMKIKQRVIKSNVSIREGWVGGWANGKNYANVDKRENMSGFVITVI